MRTLLLAALLLPIPAHAAKVLYALKGEQKLVEVCADPRCGVTAEATVLCDERKGCVIPQDFDKSQIGAYETCQKTGKESLCVNAAMKASLDQKKADDAKKAEDKAAQEAAAQEAIDAVKTKPADKASLEELALAVKALIEKSGR